MKAMIQFQHVSRRYPGDIVAINDISLDIFQGEFIFLTGPSGAGKSTLLKMIAAIEPPDTGTLLVNDQDISKISVAGIPFLRRNLGLVLQQHGLLNEQSILANTMLPLLVMGTDYEQAKQRALLALEKVNLNRRADSLPMSLSEGERQRVAVARAIVNRPQIILADEPTANLDHSNADQVMKTLSFFRSANVTCIVSTHDESLLSLGDRVVYLDHGHLIKVETVNHTEVA